MGKDFFDRLFNGNVNWAFHTTMTCNIVYSTSMAFKMVGKELGKEGLVSSEMDKTGVFYDNNHSKGRCLTFKGSGTKLNVNKYLRMFFPVSDQNATHNIPQTFHAKISLVSYKDDDSKNKYRLAIYSKNHDYNESCIEAALLFDLVECDQNDNGLALVEYIEYIKDNTNTSGKDWIEKHITDEVKKTIKKCILKSEFGKEADLFFGGILNNNYNNGHTTSIINMNLRLQDAEDDSIVITPPEFIRGTNMEKFFAGQAISDGKSSLSGKKILYDLAVDLKLNKEAKKTSSHIKQYLLHKKNNGGDIFELWVGSANAIPSGIGITLNNPSVECLVKFKLTQYEFDAMSKEIKERYRPFDFSANQQGSLVQNLDKIGPAIIENYECRNIEYDLNTRYIKITLSLKESKKFDKDIKIDDLKSVPWRALECKNEQEYFSVIDTDGKICEKIVLEYKVSRKTQGILLFGKSCCMMDISSKLPDTVPRVKDPIEKETRLTEWLINYKNPGTNLPVYDSSWSDELKWYYNVLKFPKTSEIPDSVSDIYESEKNEKNLKNELCLDYKTIPECTEKGKTKPKSFQLKAAEKLCEILESDSRVFLADEPGLGKTYTSAMVIKKLAEREDDQNPIFVIYIAPNLALLENNGAEIVRKYRSIADKESKDIVLLNDLVNEESVVRCALEDYYNNEIKKIEKKINARKKIKLKSILTNNSEMENAIRNLDVGNLEDSKISESEFKQKMIAYLKNTREKEEKSHKRGKTWLGEAYYYAKNPINPMNPKESESYRKIAKFDDFEKDIITEYIRVKEDVDNEEKNKLKAILDDEEKFNKLVETEIKNKDGKGTDGYGKQYFLWPYYHNYPNKKDTNPDRLALAEKLIDEYPRKKILNGKIVLITMSVRVALDYLESKDFAKVPQTEKEYIEKKAKERGFEPSRYNYALSFLERYSPELIIWDEFHRNIDKINNSINPFFYWEKYKKSKTKCLFLSATPYRTNISGKENERALSDLYESSLDDESVEVELPDFSKSFVPLFCGGKENQCINQVKLKEAYICDDKKTLQAILEKRMVRNERNRLQGTPEKHISINNAGNQFDVMHATILRNTALQCELLRQSGYAEGAIRWGISLPWILSFSTDRTKIIKEKGDYSFFKILTPGFILNNSLTNTISSNLFAYYGASGVPNSGVLSKLPEYNLAMNQICKENIPDKYACQLIWMPATIPLYKTDDNSIFNKYKDYSKLLVFAEYRYLQRGGARLISDYCRLLLGQTPLPSLTFNIKYRKDISFDKKLFEGDCREKTLDQLLSNIEGNNIEKLYKIASPAACGQALGLDSEKLTNLFNGYINLSGVKEALYSWLLDHNYVSAPIDSDLMEEGILRYCAEGNLFSVLEEWLFCIKEESSDERMSLIESVFKRITSKVGVQTLYTTNNLLDGIPGDCGFAEQMTGDSTDVASGEDESFGIIGRAFNSPFYPMILFAGRGAQEGIDMHNYCLRIMHLTLPRGAVSYEQRNGRIDRFRSLLVRRRAAEIVEKNKLSFENNSLFLLNRIFKWLATDEVVRDNMNPEGRNKLYPDWNIPDYNSKYHFEELMPLWECTKEFCYVVSIREMYSRYRTAIGDDGEISDQDGEKTDIIDLSTIE